jgi:hypothetical protein
MTILHDAPYLLLQDANLLKRFCTRCGIDPAAPVDEIIGSVARAFGAIPFENLTKIIKSDAVISARSAMRTPDMLIGDWLSLGTGGTCFSLTAATIGVFTALGIAAYPLLADRHYGPDTHSGLLVKGETGLYLLDPGYLLFAPVLLPSTEPAVFQTGFNTIELVPLPGGLRLELYTVVKGNRKLRLTFKIAPVDAFVFAKAWERSFEFEMMHYPVLTRCVSGEHHYLQGDTLAIRNSVTTRRTKLTTQEQMDYYTRHAGIDRSVVCRALEILTHAHAFGSSTG